MENDQGADMLQLALPEALAMHYVKEELGEEAVDLIIQKKNDLYNKDRYNEPNQEPVLLNADGAEYLEENKGAIALYNTSNEIGLSKFVEKINGWSQKDGNNKTFKSLIDYLKPEILTEPYEEI